MKGKYSGSHMTIYGSVMPKAASIAQSAHATQNITEDAKYRIKVVDWHRRNGNSISLTARHFGYNDQELAEMEKRKGFHK